MSTYVYLQCLDHEPPLSADGESGQHLTDLPQIRADLADRARITASIRDGWDAGDHFRNNTARFLASHEKCRIGIRDEYGVEHPTTEGAEDHDRLVSALAALGRVRAIVARSANYGHDDRGLFVVFVGDLRAALDGAPQ